MAASSIAMSISGALSSKTSFLLDEQTERISNINTDQIVVIAGTEESLNSLRKFIVSRPHMIALSPRWKEVVSRQSKLQAKIIRRPFWGRKATTHVVLPSDDAAAVRLVLCIAHLQYDKLPKKLDFQELVRLAEVAERYELNPILLPHVKPWLQHYISRLLEPGYEQWLYIAWQFGFEEEFLKLACHLALRCAVNDGGQLLIPTTDQVVEGRFPKGVLRKFDMDSGVYSAQLD